jgi:hypothetical protein
MIIMTIASHMGMGVVRSLLAIFMALSLKMHPADHGLSQKGTRNAIG